MLPNPTHCTFIPNAEEARSQLFPAELPGQQDAVIDMIKRSGCIMSDGVRKAKLNVPFSRRLAWIIAGATVGFTLVV